MERLEVSAASVLRLAPHIVFRFDDTRQRWIMMAPERLMLPDEQAVQIPQLVGGETGLRPLIHPPATPHTHAPRQLVPPHLTPLLPELAHQGWLAPSPA